MRHAIRTAFPSPLASLLLTVAVLAAVAFALPGCASSAPAAAGNDPLVVNAERSIDVSFAAVDAFLAAEHDNRAAVARDLPAVHAFAEQVRRDGPRAFTEARDAVRLYKSSRTIGDGDAMNAKLARVQSLARTAREYLVRVQTR